MTDLTTCDGKVIRAHWSDDPRFTSQEHYDAVMSGKETHKVNNAPNDRAGIDYSAQEGVPLYSWIKRRGD